jgi:hypothetical protein
MSNPHPRLENLKPFKPVGEKAMHGRLFVRVPLEIEKAVRSRPNSQNWLRDVITKAIEKEKHISNKTETS